MHNVMQRKNGLMCTKFLKLVPKLEKFGGETFHAYVYAYDLIVTSLYGDLTQDRLRKGTSYRNPILAEAAKVLGFVNRFGRGIFCLQFTVSNLLEFFLKLRKPQ